MLLKQLFIIGISCCLVACASTQEDDQAAAGEEATRFNDCIHEPSIRGYNVLDEQNLIVDASGRRSYHVALQRPARGLRHSHFIAFDATTSRICPGFDAIRYDGDMGDTGAIRILSIRELTEEDEEYLLIKFGKKEPEIEQTPAPQDVEGAEVEELDEAASE
jgi:hypothetical protein